MTHLHLAGSKFVQLVFVISTLLALYFHAFSKENPAEVGFSRGQCTWYVYLRAQERGWLLHFDQPYNRHGRNWWEKVVNANQNHEPTVGSVMVMDSWAGNPYGHVTYVEEIKNNNEWVITHCNLNLGKEEKALFGEKVFKAVCKRAGDEILFEGYHQRFKIRGFLSPSDN
jgi:surface antigen